MRRIATVVACLALLGVGACGNSTAPAELSGGEARMETGMVGSGYNTTPPDTTPKIGGTVGSGY
ncbi:MAG TPA: hypothetical protein VF746_30410 [Longimicrobium sp.]